MPTCSFAACRPAAAACAAPTLPDQRRSRRVYLRLSPRTLEKQRVIGGGPEVPQVRPPRHVRRGDLDAWADAAQLRGHVRPRNMPNATRATTVMVADRRRAGGHRHVQPIAPAAAAAQQRTARSVPRTAGRGHGAARCPGLDGLSVLLAGQVAAHGADRLSQRQRHHPRGRHTGTRHRHHLGRRHPDLGRQPDRGSRDAGIPTVAQDAGYAYGSCASSGAVRRCATTSA